MNKKIHKFKRDMIDRRRIDSEVYIEEYRFSIFKYLSMWNNKMVYGINIIIVFKN
jgi:hypothetical protein